MSLKSFFEKFYLLIYLQTTNTFSFSNSNNNNKINNFRNSIMSQTFNVVRCYECGVFQVDINKKSTNKWSCKMCGSKQSLKQVKKKLRQKQTKQKMSLEILLLKSRYTSKAIRKTAASTSRHSTRSGTISTK